MDAPTDTATILDCYARVAQPGKFQGEPAWVPWYYDLALGGFGEEVAENAVEFDVEPAEELAFPGSLDDVTRVRLITREDGFVYAKVLRIGSTAWELARTLTP